MTNGIYIVDFLIGRKRRCRLTSKSCNDVKLFFINIFCFTISFSNSRRQLTVENYRVQDLLCSIITYWCKLVQVITVYCLHTCYSVSIWPKHFWLCGIYLWPITIGTF